jgi:hypothetical protein
MSPRKLASTGSFHASLVLNYAEDVRRKLKAGILRSGTNQRGRTTQPKYQAHAKYTTPLAKMILENRTKVSAAGFPWEFLCPAAGFIKSSAPSLFQFTGGGAVQMTDAQGFAPEEDDTDCCTSPTARRGHLP